MGLLSRRLFLDTATGHPTVGIDNANRPLAFLYDNGLGDSVDVRSYLSAAIGAGIDVADGTSHPLSAVYPTAASMSGAFPLTATFMTTLGWQAIQATDELAWAVIQEALLAGWAANKAIYLPMALTAAGSGSYPVNRTLVAKTGTRLFGDAQATWGTKILASATFRNYLSSGAIDPIQAMLRAYNPSGAGYQLDNTCRFYMEYIQLDGASVRPPSTTGATTATSAVLTDTGQTFTSEMVGAIVSIVGAGPNGGTFTDRILADSLGANVVTLGIPASRSSATPAVDVPYAIDTSTTGATVVNSAQQVSGLKMTLQQPSMIRNCFFNHFSDTGLWLEGQDQHVENVAAFNCTIGFRLRTAQFCSLINPNVEVWAARGFLIESERTINTLGQTILTAVGSVWLKHLHAENQSSLIDATYLMEVAASTNVVVDTGHFTQYSTTTKHHGFLVSGTAITTALAVLELRNQETAALDSLPYYAVRDYARGVHLTWADVGRQMNYGGVRQADVGTTQYPWTRLLAASNGKQLRMVGSDASQAVLDVYPGSAQTADAQIWRNTAGTAISGIGPDGILHGPYAPGLLPLASLQGGFGPGQNLLKDSHDPSLWTVGGGGGGGTVTVTANAVAAPDATVTATQIDWNDATLAVSNVYVRNQTGVTNQSGKTLCASIWLKADAAGTIPVRCYSSTGTVTVLTCSVTTAWTRFYFTVVPSDNAQIFFEVIRTALAHLIKVYAWGAQVEEATYPGPLVRVLGTTPKSVATPGLVAGRHAYHAIGGFASGSKAIDFGSVADGAMTSTTVTVAGLADDGTWTCTASLYAASGTKPVAGLLVGAFPDPTTASQAIVTLVNHTGGALDLASATLRVNAVKVAG